MNWNDIRYLLAVSRHGGLTGASRELKVSQSTVARRIETLETALRTRLFERHTNGYELTEAGRGMVDRAIPIESRMVELLDDFKGRDTEVSGVVRRPRAAPRSMSIQCRRKFSPSAQASALASCPASWLAKTRNSCG
ncbi:LysR family transcriptional regulator [Aestuariivirga sp. YIM B02566]|uniref:LysR family transcriptional regulator n=1 Tax=Taklimakanibacter albus TaxID=2800327 RepID=A0ACC5R074_9HYPH|nr:LysR family transcriptional regulator [Aestuariivirga sp. YIM B02566]MBK1866066.1 LysR family transcriptional regulator [Aestuariivirga sp. YIM B02566]